MFGAYLSQVRPSSTTAGTLFTVPTNVWVEITHIVVANVSGASCTYRLFHDDDGTTYDQTTALAYDISLPANTTQTWSAETYGGIFIAPGGSLGARTSVADAITFTTYGGVMSAR